MLWVADKTSPTTCCSLPNHNASPPLVYTKLAPLSDGGSVVWATRNVHMAFTQSCSGCPQHAQLTSDGLLLYHYAANLRWYDDDQLAWLTWLPPAAEAPGRVAAPNCCCCCTNISVLGWPYDDVIQSVHRRHKGTISTVEANIITDVMSLKQSSPSWRSPRSCDKSSSLAMDSNKNSRTSRICDAWF